MATYYWVGGNGTWDASSTANWSLTSGGLPGVAAPNNTDTVIFDSLSGTGTCTTASGSACAIATLNSSTLVLKLGANHTMSGTFTLTLGSLDLNSNTLTCNMFNFSTTNVRSIAFGTGKIVLTGNNANIWRADNLTNFTLTGTPNVEATYSGSTGTRTFTNGLSNGTEATAINLRVTAGSDTISPFIFLKNIDLTGFSGTLTNNTRSIYGGVIFSAGMTVNAGNFVQTFAATSGTQQITTNGKTLDFPITQSGASGTVQLQDNLTMGSTRTFTLTAGALDLSSGNRTLNTGLFSSSNSNIRSIAFGTGNITVTGNATTVLGMNIVTNFSYTGTPTINATYSGGTGTRTLRFGSTGGATEAQVLSVNISAGTDVVDMSSSRYLNFNFTGFSGTISAYNFVLFGDFTLSPTMTLTGATQTITFSKTTGTQQITTAGRTIDTLLTFNGIGGTFAFQDALTQGSTRQFLITNGTVQLKNGVTSTVGSFATSGTNQKFLQSTLAGSQATLSQASGTVNTSYLTIRDINAVGGATWNAYLDQFNVDAGNNDGWDFGISPVVGGAEYTYALRSFTQPRRF